MTISEHAETFAGLPIQEYERDGGLKAPQSHAWLLTLGDDDYDAPEPLSGLIERFAAEKGADRVQAIVIGTFEEMAEKGGSDQTVKALVAAAAKLTSLKALFFGDITVRGVRDLLDRANRHGAAARGVSSPRRIPRARRHWPRVRQIQHATLRLDRRDRRPRLQDRTRRGRCRSPRAQHLELWLGD